MVTACIFMFRFSDIVFASFCRRFGCFYYFSQLKQGTYLIWLNSPYVTPADNSV